MKYLKKFESIRDEYPDMFEPLSDEEKPEFVPGFEDGTIDPDDTEGWTDMEGYFHEPQSKDYEKFLKITKERNFEETNTEIKINLYKLSQDFCMSIYNHHKHLYKFLNDELIGKFISDGFYNILTDYKIKGLIEKVFITYHDDKGCYNFFNLKLKDLESTDHTSCHNIITIDKIKTEQNKYNL